MGIQKLNDDDFEYVVRQSIEQDSPSALYRLWLGYVRSAEKLKQEQNELLVQGKHDEAASRNRAILQAEKFASLIAQSRKFQDFRSKFGGCI